MCAARTATEEQSGFYGIPERYLTHELARGADSFRLSRSKVCRRGLPHSRIALAIRAQACQGPLKLALLLASLQEIGPYRLVHQFVHRPTQQPAEMRQGGLRIGLESEYGR